MSEPRSGALRPVAGIDIGTNSIHLLIASVDPELRSFSVLLTEKSTTRLGERDPVSGDLSPEAIERAFTTLRHCRELAASHGVDPGDVVTAATSAVREAPNGREFLQSIQEQLGLAVDLVSGPEEARLIYLGVLSGMSFGEKPHVIIDIGGGSTELVLADASDSHALTSTRIGAVRLQRDFVQDDPIPAKRVTFLRAFIQGALEPAVLKVRQGLKRLGDQPVMVATSGTAMAIAAMAAADEARPPLRMQGYRVSRQKLDQIVERLLGMTPAERKAHPALNERRAEIIVPGALILQTAMGMIGAEELVISERALREGLIVDWMLRNDLIVDRFAFQSSIRQRTVLHQAQRYGVDVPRSERVAALAIRLYDQSHGLLHQDDGQGRQLLWAAAMLHSCGQHINVGAYHKHTWYLIRHGDLLGYSDSEQLMVAAIARYHRRSLPKKRHESWQLIEGREQRRTVSAMALLLRLAVAMDRRPQKVIADCVLQANAENGIAIQLLPLTAEVDLNLERWSLRSCESYVEESLGLTLQVS
ncbi:Ppx/GppA phosphatase family protein [Synechococcus sp. NB0720_010]|uniref:Ppx/GppA phosphatase family protein n=1 Tax=Synechococcus sp. NB0720_010 TaxID=2907159 RepID=UPI001FFB4FA3|nr:Ppx/GppA phosphatase family protein [Synechococcus sp. NB0720_010]UPH90977.1 Ppx/GppA family phosphatase [Synechococcus sp. NB0720_010]